MGNCCSSRKQKEQLPRPPPGRRRYSLGNTYNTYRTNPVLELLEEEYQSNRNLEIKKKGRPRREKYDLDGVIGPRRIEAWESRGNSRSGVRQRAVRGAGRSRAIRSSKSRKKTKTRRRKRMDFIEDDEECSDSEDSETETSDDDSDSDSDDDSGIDHRKMSKSVKRRRNQQSRRKRPGKREKVIDENEDEDEYKFLEEKDDNDDDEEEEQDEDSKNDKRKNKKKSKSKQNAKENSNKRVRAKIKPKSKVKKLVEDDKIALLGTEDDDNDDEVNDAEDEDEQGDACKHPQNQASETEERTKGKEIEKPSPYRWTNPSPIFDKNKSSIYQRARAKGSDRESIRQLEIQRHRKRRERESSSLKKPKRSILEDTGDDDWTDTDASSLAPSKRSGSTSSRLSSLFGPRNRSLTPEPTSLLMSPISPLTRPSISSRTGETTFGATVIRTSPLQEIVSADSLPANPEPNDTIITPPPPAVHQRAFSPLPKASDPCMEGMKKVIFMSRGKRSSIKLVPSDGKLTDSDDVEIILTK
ncbi:hypothetical protein OCU04_009570 [Sclerotinia nivalis]|uniref:Uncharacterized protein n=1 Tax=Sclerotinia nivalis TaxID=352851 RepID=A0A9X0DI92_9HELO|nr:hypothetical protein OCU04_009570 [Sclerotinia nivalis]